MSFYLFRSHLDLAHQYFRRLVSPEDIVIDATCGNGHDTHFLYSLHPQKLYAIDIQEEAIASAKEKLPEEASVEFILGCHSQFPEEISPESVQMIIYNLGYLPGGDKQKTTLAPTTLNSLRNASKLIKPGGAISVTCYPGHPEGQVEQKAILDWAASLAPDQWSCCHHCWINRKNAPSLLLIQRTVK